METPNRKLIRSKRASPGGENKPESNASTWSRICNSSKLQISTSKSPVNFKNKVYPSIKPNGATANLAAVAVTTNPAATKIQLYNPMRHPYRPNPTAHHRHNFCQCRFNCRRSLLHALPPPTAPHSSSPP
ncbi:Uncharacterized protein Fot_15713 [Forsythia ovata]|uniref:Uncharacterized protein n=1 Tax=Forsythia ovata TaxID=205694 RepID=A0ABD1W9X4_9LAMI